MATGRVKYFYSTKGYGFIQPEDGGKEVFVHISDLEASGIQHLREGQWVSFDLARKAGRVSAANIKLVDRGNE